MNRNERFLENRNLVDSAMQMLLLDTREIVCGLVRPLAAQGRFSLENIPADRRGNLRTVDDIARTMDPTALLSALLECLSDRSGPALLEIPGVNYQLVDKVRRIRNDHAHGEGEYNDFNYVRDAVNAANHLRSCLLNARPLPSRPVAATSRFRAKLRRSIPRPTIPKVRSPQPPIMPVAATPEVEAQPSQSALESAAPPEERPWDYKTRINQELESTRQNLEAKAAIGLAIQWDIEEETTGGNLGWTALHAAIKNGYIEAASELISEGAGLNAQNATGWTSLNTATYYGQAELVKQLLSAGADLGLANNEGRTPLHVAAELGHSEIVGELISEGAGLNAQNATGWTSLNTATYYGQAELVKQLLSAGADPDLANNEGRTPLHVAAELGQTETVKKLIAEGAHVNVQNQDGMSPLHEAAKNGHEATTKELLDSGALIDVRNNNRKTPGQIASEEVIAVFNSRTRIAGRPQYYLGNLGLILLSPAIPLMLAVISVHLVALAFGPSSIETSMPLLWLFGLLFAVALIWWVFLEIIEVSDSYLGFNAENAHNIFGYIILQILSVPIGFVVATVAYFAISSIFPDSWATGISTSVGRLMADLLEVAPDWKVLMVGFNLPALIEAGGYWIKHLGSRLVATLTMLFGLLMLVSGLFTMIWISGRLGGRKREELLLTTGSASTGQE